MAAAHVAQCAVCQQHLAELAGLGDELRALPGLEPPPGLWPDIVRRADQMQRRQGTQKRFAWALAASVVIGVSIAPWVGDATQQAAITPSRAETSALIRQSHALDQALHALAPDYRVMRARTANTIADLEDGVAAVDYELSSLGSEDRQGAQWRNELWRQRVDLMRSLYTVQYIQARYRGD